MTTARVQIPPKLIPVFLGEARYRGAYGGRGSAKTRTFAKMTAIRGFQWSQAGEEGVIVCGREFMNSLDDSSFAEVKAAILSEPWLAAHYDCGEKYIRTIDGRIEYKFVGLRHNLDNIKSKARIKLLWVDEAEAVSETAWEVAVPTVREHDSEIWLTWNPRLKTSATNKRFRAAPPPDAKIVEMNWRDNPWFPAVLEKERQNDLALRPDRCGHIWEGEFGMAEGAYFAKQILAMKAGPAPRLGRVPADPLMTLRLFADIGGTGAKADNFVFWVAQFIGREIRVLDHYEVQGQPIDAHLAWMRGRGYSPERAQIWLPHDGATHDRVYAVSYESAFQAAGYTVTVIPNQGKGAASARIEAVRRMFPAIWMNEATTEAGLDQLGAYHEKRDDHGHGLGPEHDGASHSADAFGLICVAYEMPRTTAPEDLNKRSGLALAGAQGWMQG